VEEGAGHLRVAPAQIRTERMPFAQRAGGTAIKQRCNDLHSQLARGDLRSTAARAGSLTVGRLPRDEACERALSGDRPRGKECQVATFTPVLRRAAQKA